MESEPRFEYVKGHFTNWNAIFNNMGLLTHKDEFGQYYTAKVYGRTLTHDIMSITPEHEVLK